MRGKMLKYAIKRLKSNIDFIFVEYFTINFLKIIYHFNEWLTDITIISGSWIDIEFICKWNKWTFELISLIHTDKR